MSQRTAEEVLVEASLEAQKIIQMAIETMKSARERITQAEAAREAGCAWTADDDGEIWETSCGKSFVFIDGTPDANEMNFCCYCGKELKQIDSKEDPEDKDTGDYEDYPGRAGES